MMRTSLRKKIIGIYHECLFLLFLIDEKIYMLTSSLTMCISPNSLTKWNKSVAVALSFPNSLLALFSYSVLENFASTKTLFLLCFYNLFSACLHFPNQNKMLFIIFLCLLKFFLTLLSKTACSSAFCSYQIY